ncbi:DUF3025 domain-containing protein [Thauera sp. JM12B12]|uniref:DUF3025 domain-containing protein n=1 Tax=Thauera sp. JM12B12 TaxID=3142262 RepID=UPI0031F42309
MDTVDDVPAAFARRPLFEPIAPWLARFTAPGVPAHAALDALLTETADEARSGGGAPIRFVPPADDPAGYEAQIFNRGEVPTRSGNWHDFFNALAWCAWPQSKAACNRLHLDELRARTAAGLAGRGRRRDALTQFDECGIVVVSSDAAIAGLLAAHAWHDAFWLERSRLLQTTRFLVFGHGSWDQLRAPFFGLCAKALYRVVSDEWHNLDERTRLSDTDAWLASQLRARIEHLTPRDFSPLPLLGIPGVVPDSESADYYLDTRQFRPRREHAA